VVKHRVDLAHGDRIDEGMSRFPAAVPWTFSATTSTREHGGLADLLPTGCGPVRDGLWRTTGTETRNSQARRRPREPGRSGAYEMSMKLGQPT
jgi:hypothetical protein